MYSAQLQVHELSFALAVQLLSLQLLVYNDVESVLLCL